MISHRLIRAIALVAFFGTGWFGATLIAAEPAVVKADQIAVRAEPSAKSERLRGSLKKGDIVLVTGDVADPKAQGNEPRRWAEIEMPSRFPVWVAAELVDPKSGSVKSDKANLRSGPGKNFSRVGQLSKGSKITQVRIQEGWMQIEPPPAAHAFIAADLVDKNPSKPAIAHTAPPRKPAAAAAPLPDRAAGAVQPTPARPLLSAAAPPSAPRQPLVRSAVGTPEPVANSPVNSSTPPASSQFPVITPTAPPPSTESTPAIYSKPPTTLSTTNWVATKRKVLREGYLVASMNPKAPSGYALISKNRSEGLMNYIYTEDARINLKQFQNIFVVVSGEEWLDPKFKTTPILIADSVSLE